ncbi:MAG: hypothetical protein KatS3mg131_2759 [Candidatus Tectimicrobiota bacterium]|nr:MAG: hypothetical protein KatS3mg131_2759 [Candidatus Tectomicrobia bacterium]
MVLALLSAVAVAKPLKILQVYTVESDSVEVAPEEAGAAQANCSPLDWVLGGGFEIIFEPGGRVPNDPLEPFWTLIYNGIESETSWRVSIHNKSSEKTLTVIAFARCAGTPLKFPIPPPKR